MDLNKYIEEYVNYWDSKGLVKSNKNKLNLFDLSKKTKVFLEEIGLPINNRAFEDQDYVNNYISFSAVKNIRRLRKEDIEYDLDLEYMNNIVIIGNVCGINKPKFLIGIDMNYGESVIRISSVTPLIESYYFYSSSPLQFALNIDQERKSYQRIECIEENIEEEEYIEFNKIKNNILKIDPNTFRNYPKNVQNVQSHYRILESNLKP